MEKKNMAKREQVKIALGLDDELMDLLAPEEELNAALIKELEEFKDEIETEFARCKRTDTSWEGVTLYIAMEIQKKLSPINALLEDLNRLIPGIIRKKEDAVNGDNFIHIDNMDIINFRYPLIDTIDHLKKSEKKLEKLIENLKAEMKRSLPQSR